MPISILRNSRYIWILVILWENRGLPTKTSPFYCGAWCVKTKLGIFVVACSGWPFPLNGPHVWTRWLDLWSLCRCLFPLACELSIHCQGRRLKFQSSRGSNHWNGWTKESITTGLTFLRNSNNVFSADFFSSSCTTYLMHSTGWNCFVSKKCSCRL